MSAPSTAAAPPIRIVLVDDQELLRAGFAMVIGSQPDMEVVGQAANGRDAIELLRSTRADVVLMDIRMPELDGISATESILATAGDAVRIIVLTTFDLDDYALSAVRAGASGFLLKDAAPEDLLAAIRTVHRGDAVIAPSTTRRLLTHLSPLLAAPNAGPDPELTAALDRLTAREREVLIEMAHGLSNTEIATKFFVSEATVKTHVSRVLAKLPARDRVQAVVHAYEAGLVGPNS